MKEKEPFIVWPGIMNLRQIYFISTAFLFFFYIVYASTFYITSFYSARIPLYFDFELNIPFIPAMAAVYLSIILMMSLAPFIFRNRQEIMPLIMTLVAETIIAGIIFLLIPIKLGFSDPLVIGFWSSIFNLADTLNLHYNDLPSLHVAFAFTTALSFSMMCNRTGKIIFISWAIMIANGWVDKKLVNDVEMHFKETVDNQDILQQISTF